MGCACSDGCHLGVQTASGPRAGSTCHVAYPWHQMPAQALEWRCASMTANSASCTVPTKTSARRCTHQTPVHILQRSTPSTALLLQSSQPINSKKHFFFCHVVVLPCNRCWWTKCIGYCAQTFLELKAGNFLSSGVAMCSGSTVQTDDRLDCHAYARNVCARARSVVTVDPDL